MLQLLGVAFALVQQQLSGEKGGTVPYYTPRAPFFSKNSFLLLLCRQGCERREGGRGAEADIYKTTETSAKSFVLSAFLAHCNPLRTENKSLLDDRSLIFHHVSWDTFSHDISVQAISLSENVRPHCSL